MKTTYSLDNPYSLYTNLLLRILILASVFLLTMDGYIPALARPLQQVPNDTPTATSQSLGTFERPIVVINNYSTNPSPRTPGQDFNLVIEIYNAGQTSARN